MKVQWWHFSRSKAPLPSRDRATRAAVPTRNASGWEKLDSVATLLPMKSGICISSPGLPLKTPQTRWLKEENSIIPQNQSWIFTGRTDAKVEATVLWPPDAKNWLIGKDPDAGKDWRQEEKGMTEDEMVGWHHQLEGHELEQAPGVGDGQGSLTCCSP